MMDHTSGMEKQIRTLKKRSLFTLFLTWLALFFTVIGIAAGYKNFLRVHDKAKQASFDAKVSRDILPELARKDSIQEWQEQVREQLRSSQQQNAQELKALKEVSNTSAYVADTLSQQVQQLTLQQEILKSPHKQANLWKAEEVRFLLRTALRKVQLDKDVVGAEKALTFADQVLIDIGLSMFLPVRQAIADDVASLKNRSMPDSSQLVNAIDQLSEELKALMILESPVAAKSQGLLDVPDGRNSLLQRVQASISEVVVIKQYDQALAKRIKGDVKSIRFELLRLKMENLKQLALTEQADAFWLQLQTIHEILQFEHSEIYSEDLALKLDALESLMTVPELPILRSPALLDQTLADASDVEVR